jgi:transposase
MADRVAMESRRLEAAQLLQQGIHAAEVARRAGVTRTSASRWEQRLKAGKSLQRTFTPGRPSRLIFDCILRVYRSLPESEWTGVKFAAAIFDAYGVRYAPDHAGRLLSRCRLQ